MTFLLIDDAGEREIMAAPLFQADGILSANAPGGKDFDEMMSVTHHLSGFASILNQ
jgi:hypothetical protein